MVQHPSLPFPMSLCSSLSQTTFEPVMRSHRDAVYLVAVMVSGGNVSVGVRESVLLAVGGSSYLVRSILGSPGVLTFALH